MSALEVTIPGAPVPKGRPRFVRGHVITPPETKAHESKIGWLSRAAAAVLGWLLPPKIVAYAVTMRLYRAYRFKGGDIDNLSKTVLDGLNGIAYADDARVVELHAYILQDAANPRTEVTVVQL